MNPPDDFIRLRPAAEDRVTIEEVLKRRLLRAAFQPIVNFSDGSLHGYEALIRGPQGTDMESPEALLGAARRAGRSTDFELTCLKVVSSEFMRLKLPGKLFANLSAEVLVHAHAQSEAILSRAVAIGLNPGRVVIELTEHERVTNHAELFAVASDFRRRGVSMALDDFGDGRSSLRLWSELLPEIVKIDMYFIRDIDRTPTKLQAIRLLLQFTEVFGTQLVAEGIETAGELAVLRDLGVEFGQGYLFGRPQSPPPLAIPTKVGDMLASRKLAVFPELLRMPQRHQTVAQLLIAAPTAAPQTTNDELGRLFREHPDLNSVAVVEGGIPLGLVNRSAFLNRYAQQYQRELYGRRPCTLFMGNSPLQIDISTPIEALTRVLVGDDQRYLSDGYIIVDNGRYMGLGRGDDLVSTVTELRIEAARHANPLTMLPGNIPLTEHIARLLAANNTFASCYFDLNHFKPFNDQYGYWKGDEMIKLAARSIASQCDPLRDFLGHVGGDDFVVLFQSDDWRARCEKVVETFNAQAAGLFNKEDIARGVIVGEDRQGNPATFPLTTIAVGAVVVAPGEFRSAEDVASAAAAAKRKAKHTGIGVYLLASRDYEHTAGHVPG